MLGSVGKDKPSLRDIFEFYAVHERWLTSNDRAMPLNAYQGDWTIDAIGLPSAVLKNRGRMRRIIWKSRPDDEQKNSF